jgi:hypothetical protein
LYRLRNISLRRAQWRVHDPRPRLWRGQAGRGPRDAIIAGCRILSEDIFPLEIPRRRQCCGNIMLLRLAVRREACREHVEPARARAYANEPLLYKRTSHVASSASSSTSWPRLRWGAWSTRHRPGTNRCNPAPAVRGPPRAFLRLRGRAFGSKVCALPREVGYGKTRCRVGSTRATAAEGTPRRDT